MQFLILHISFSIPIRCPCIQPSIFFFCREVSKLLIESLAFLIIFHPHFINITILIFIFESDSREHIRFLLMHFRIFQTIIFPPLHRPCVNSTNLITLRKMSILLIECLCFLPVLHKFPIPYFIPNSVQKSNGREHIRFLLMFFRTLKIGIPPPLHRPSIQSFIFFSCWEISRLLIENFTFIILFHPHFINITILIFIFESDSREHISFFLIHFRIFQIIISPPILRPSISFSVFPVFRKMSIFLKKDFCFSVVIIPIKTIIKIFELYINGLDSVDDIQLHTFDNHKAVFSGIIGFTDTFFVFLFGIGEKIILTYIYYVVLKVKNNRSVMVIICSYHTASHLLQVYIHTDCTT